ncbi:MAG: alpha/beta hydrolase [Caldilineaceae bacterium]|nr:alpha/beta hydrolase [Caldilineaceae bacterium]
MPASFFVDTARLRFFCRAWGEDDGIPLLLLHGSYGTGRWWERLAAVLPPEIYAIAPDLRGCGQSDKRDQGYDVGSLARDVLALIDAIGWDDAHLMAHSSSGAVAIEAALNYPERFATLTLVDSVPVEGVFTPIDTYMLLEQMRDDRDLLRNALATLMPALFDSDNEDDRHFFDQLVADAAEMAPAAYTEVARGLADWNRFADARRLTLPTLLAWGERDRIVDRDATTRTLIAIPGANNLEVLRGAGHCPMIETPQALANRWVDFITQDFADYESIRSSAYEDGDEDDNEAEAS